MKRAEKPQAPRERTKKSKVEIFLATFAQTGSIKAAASAAKVTRDAHYKWLTRDPDYKKQFEETSRLAANYVESALLERAINGWTEGIYYQGKRCGTVKRYDTYAAVAVLRALVPERYGQRTEIHAELSGTVELVQRMREARRRVLEMERKEEAG